jgi:hypothetical protein
MARPLDGGDLTPNEARMLVALKLSSGSRVPREAVAAAIWGDHPPRTWRKALNVYSCRLRRAGFLVEGGREPRRGKGVGCGGVSLGYILKR